MSGPRRPPSRRPRPTPARRRPRPHPPPPNHHGLHVLRDRRVARRLVGAAALGPGDLVLDLGAGPGTLTLPLARTGARVIAVERDPRLARKLARRTADDPAVRVVEADLRTVPLPRRPYAVVANLPFATGTDLLRRLLGDGRSALTGADLLVEWGFARRLTDAGAAHGSGGAEVARWHRRWRLDLVGRVPATAFSPPPRVDAAHLSVRRR